MSPRRGGGQDERKLRQLCSQIGRAIDLTLVGDCEDEVLQNMSVESVEPASGNRLNVTLQVRPPGSEMDKNEVMTRLEQHRPLLIQEILRAVTRRNIPEISFWIVKAPD